MWALGVIHEIYMYSHITVHFTCSVKTTSFMSYCTSSICHYVACQKVSASFETNFALFPETYETIYLRFLKNTETSSLTHLCNTKNRNLCLRVKSDFLISDLEFYGLSASFKSRCYSFTGASSESAEAINFVKHNHFGFCPI